jgi:unsaturated rhamnogalacturonyl hydrolase
MQEKKLKKQINSFLLFFGLIIAASAFAVDEPRSDKIATDRKWSERMALTVMQQSPEAWQMMHYKLLEAPKWDYTYGLVLSSFQNLYLKTSDERYLTYGKQYIDQMIDKDGNIKSYDIYNFSLDHINNGKLLFLLHEKYKDDRYLKVMDTLRTQLTWQPRTRSQGFWHKLIYPYQMWLDGLYMGTTYWAMHAAQFNEPEAVFDDIAHQFILVEQKTRDPETGLLIHAWDESGLQQWANKETGQSRYVWSRALGWYAMALVDTLEVFPKEHKNYKDLVQILNRLCEALVPYQHESGLWYQVTDKGDRYGNYLESSGTAMFAYAMGKGVRLNYLPEKYLNMANKAYDGIIKGYIEIDPANNEVYLTRTVGGTGLGNKPYRTGTFQYYVEEAVRTNDPHGVGPFIMASIELDR